MKPLEETSLREDLFKRLSEVYATIPHATQDLWDTAAQGNQSVERMLIETYRGLARFLSECPEYGRIVLYLPSELLPGTSFAGISEALSTSAQAFTHVYWNRWKELLYVYDVRASFIDGDILEEELRREPIERISKAAHLIPMLIQKGIVTPLEIEHILKTADGILRESIREAFDTGPAETVTTTMDAIDEQFLIDSRDLTTARADWLRSERVRTLIMVHAENMAREIETKKCFDSLYHDLEPEVPIMRQQVAIGALTILGRSHTISDPFAKTLIRLWNRSHPEIQDSIASLVSHWAYLGIIGQDHPLMRSTGIPAPSYSRFLSEIQPNTQDLLQELETLASHIAEDDVGTHVYPIVVAYGSRIKGYSTPEADVDIAVFIRPGTDWSKRGMIQKRLAKILIHEKIKSSPMEFWMKEKDGHLSVRNYEDFEHPDGHIGDMLFINVLVQCPWLGNRNEIATLRNVVIERYAACTDAEQRRIWIESLEHDVLQYRLMHKGYARIFPSQRSYDYLTPDAASMFWDSGYRRLASLLYLEKVMVPRT